MTKFQIARGGLATLFQSMDMISCKCSLQKNSPKFIEAKSQILKNEWTKFIPDNTDGPQEKGNRHAFEQISFNDLFLEGYTPLAGRVEGITLGISKSQYVVQYSSLWGLKYSSLKYS